MIGDSPPLTSSPREPSGARVEWLFVATAGVLFGQLASSWFEGRVEGMAALLLGARLVAGVVVLAGGVAAAGSLICGPNAIRWGVGMPLAAYGIGFLIALAAQPAAALGLLVGAPLLSGLAVATGLLSACAVDLLGRQWRRSP